MTWMIWGPMTELLGKPPFQTYCRGNYNCFPCAVFTSNSNIYIYYIHMYIYTLISKHNGDIVLVSSDLMGPNVDNHKRVFMLNIMVIPSGHWTCLAGKSPTHLGTGNIIELNREFSSKPCLIPRESITEMETNPTNMIGWILDTNGLSPSNGPFPNQVKPKRIKCPVFKKTEAPWFGFRPF